MVHDDILQNNLVGFVFLRMRLVTYFIFLVNKQVLSTILNFINCGRVQNWIRKNYFPIKQTTTFDRSTSVQSLPVLLYFPDKQTSTFDRSIPYKLCKNTKI